MRKIAVLNQKGGVGKTTSTVNIAAALARMGKKVALIDMDPQAHLTIHLGINPETAGPGVYEVLTKSADIEKTLANVRDNLYLLGANINLVGAESELVSVVGREIILKEAVETIENKFDYLIIDCAPSLGLLTLNGLAAVNEVFIPLQPHFLALQGFGKLLQTVSLVNKRINPDLKVTGILLCMYDKRATLSSEVKADIENFLQNARGSSCPWSDAKIIPITIRRNIKLAEAPSYGQTIFEYEPECNGSYDYTAVAEYVNFKMNENGQHIASSQNEFPQPEETKPQPQETAPAPVEQQSGLEQSVTAQAEDDSPPESETEKQDTKEMPETEKVSNQQQANIPIVEIPGNKQVNTTDQPEVENADRNPQNNFQNTSGINDTPGTGRDDSQLN